MIHDSDDEYDDNDNDNDCFLNYCYRPLMIKHSIDNIRTLVGAKCDLAGFVKSNPIVRD
jgi:hypothetical protein